MLSRLEIIAFATFMCLASIGRADEQVIIVMSNTFFPDISYVEVGDTIRFVNSTTQDQTIISADAAWSVGPLAAGQEAVMTVVQGISTEFRSAALFTMDGSFSFAPTPME